MTLSCSSSSIDRRGHSWPRDVSSLGSSSSEMHSFVPFQARVTWRPHSRGSFRSKSLKVSARVGGNRPAPGASRPRLKPQQRGPQGGKQEDGPIMNSAIRVPTVRLLAEDQSVVGVVSREEALERAQQVSLDLVLIAPDADPPVARIMDFGKFRYEQQKKKRDQQRRVAANRQEIKELKMRYNIDIGDYNVRLKQAIKFLKEGDKVKVTSQFRGREMEFKELGLQLFTRFITDVTEIGLVETKPQMEGRNLNMVLIPNKVALAKAAAAEKTKARQEKKQKGAVKTDGLSDSEDDVANGATTGETDEVDDADLSDSESLSDLESDEEEDESARAQEEVVGTFTLKPAAQSAVEPVAPSVPTAQL